MSTEKVDLLLSKLNNADDSTVIDIIKTLTEMPGVFVFGEILDHSSIRALQNTKHHVFHELLELFCYGSFISLQSDTHEYELSPCQLRKLKQLTIIDEAHTRRLIPYNTLLHKLKLTSHRDLEDLIIDLFYLGALSGKLNQHKSVLEVESAIGRDIRAEEVPQLNEALDTWLTRVQSVLENMENEITLANTRRSETKQEREKVQEATATLKEVMRLQLSQEAADTQRMEVDEALFRVDDVTLDSGRGINIRTFGPTDAPTGGDKEPRSKGSVFKNLRKK